MKRHVSIFAALFSLCTFADMNVTVSGYRIGEKGQIQSNLLDPNVVRVSPAGIKFVSEHGAPVTFTAIPGSGYAVVGWQGFTSNPLASQDHPETIVRADDEDGECRSVDIAFREGTTWLYLVPVLKELSGGASDTMWVTPIGYRLGSAGDITDFATSVVAVSPDSTSIARKGFPLTLTATVARDYHVVSWQKFVNVDPRSIPGTPGVEFGEGLTEVSISPEEGANQLFVAVVVAYDPVRTVKASLSSFARGTVTIDPETNVYLKGDVVTLTAQPAGGYDFVRWSDGNADHKRTLTVDDDIDLTACIEPKANRVTFSAGEEAILDITEKRVRFDCAYGELPVPVREGLVFAGWKDEFGAMITAESISARAGDHVLTAVWEIPPESYTVVFDANGGTGLQTRVEQKFEVGVSQKLRVNTFYNPGYVFVGWNQDALAEEKQYSDEQIVQDLAAGGASLTLFAVWRTEKVAYTVHFDKNADDATGTMTDQQFAGGEEKPLSGCTFKREGWTFLGWSTDPKALEPAYQDREKVQDLTMEKGGKVDLYAVWTKNPVYYINYLATDKDKEPWKTETVEQGKEYRLSDTNGLERTGYEFIEWQNGSASYPVGRKLTPQEMKKLAGEGDTIRFAAFWKGITYMLKFDGNGGTCTVGKVPMTYGNIPYRINVHKKSSGEDPQTVRAGYVLDGWGWNPAGTGEVFGIDDDGTYLYLTVTSNLTATAGDVGPLYAIWKSEKPTPSVTTNIVTFLTNGVEYVKKEVENGKTVEKPDDPTWDGYTFIGWTNETCTTGFDFDTPITGNLTLHAAWKENPQPVVDDLKKALGFTDNDPITVTAYPSDCWKESDARVELTNDCTLAFVVTGTDSVATIKAVGYSSRRLRYSYDEGKTWNSTNYPSGNQIEFKVNSGNTLKLEKSETNSSVLDYVSGSCAKQ